MPPSAGTARAGAPAALREPRFTGRDEQLRVLNLHFEDAVAGTGRTVIVHGPSGSGKSWLLDAFSRGAEAAGAWVLRGQAVEHAQSRPFQVLDGVFSAVADRALQQRDFADRLRDSAAGDMHTLRDLVPGLAQSPAVPASRASGPGQSEVVGALLRLLESLGSVSVPAVVVLDDFQWADELSSRLARQWAGRTDRFVLLVLGVRTDLRPATAHPPGLPDGAAAQIGMPALESDEVRAIAESMTGPLPAAAVHSLVERSAGSPFMTSALVRGLYESGALGAGDDGTWRFEPDPSGVQTSGEAAVVLARRLELLPEDTRRLVAVGAVLGRTFERDIAAEVVAEIGGEIGGGPATRTVGDPIVAALDRNLVWDEAGSCHFVHDHIRQAFLDLSTPDERIEAHRAAARVLAARHPGRSFEIAFHYDAAGDSAEAFPFAVAAAEQARSRYDFDLAEQHYAIAERGAVHERPGRRLEQAETFGELLMLRGRYEAALERFQLAWTLAETDSAKARIEGKLGELAFRRDDVAVAVTHLEDGLRLLGAPVPVGRLRLGWSIVAQICQLATGPLRRRNAGSGRHSDTVEARELRSRLHNRLCYARWYQCDQLTRLWMMLSSLNKGHSCPPGHERAHAYSTFGGGIGAAYPRLWRRAMGWARRGEAVHRDRGDRWGQAQAWSMQAVVLHASARYRETQQLCRRSEEVLSHVGDRWERHNATIHRISATYRLGELPEAVRSASAAYRDATEVGDVNAASTALDVWAKASGGQVPTRPISDTLRQVTEDVQARVALLEARGLVLRASGHLDEAIDSLEAARREIRRASMMNVYVVSVMSWLATLYREQAESGACPVSRARRAVRRAVWFALWYPSELPHALREAGSTTALTGRRRRARRWLRWSRAVAVRHGAAAERALTEAALAALDTAQVRPSGSGTPPTGLSALVDAVSGVLSAGTADEVLPALETGTGSLLGRGLCRVSGPGGSGDASTDEPMLRLPVLAGGTPCGELAVWLDGSDRPLASAESAAVVQLCEVAGTVLENHRLRRAGQAELTAAREGERARLARDLHDELGQALTSLLLGVRLTERSLDDDSAGDGGTDAADLDALRWQLTKLRGMAGEAVEQVQRFAFELRPSVLDDRGLTAALSALTTRMAAVTGVDITLATREFDTSRRLAPEVETAVYRIAQEALTNIGRHAHATNATVVLATLGDQLRLVIDDDGVGADLCAPARKGSGLPGMVERADQLGGSVRLESEPGEGITLVLELPLA